MSETESYPDINKVDELVDAIGALDVLGGFSRSFTVCAETGEETVGRYVEKLSDFVSPFALRSALERAFKQSHYVAGVDGVITACGRNEITLSYADGTHAKFVRVAEETV